MKRKLLAALCIAVMMFGCGCRNMNDNTGTGTETGKDMTETTEDIMKDIEKSIFPAELEQQDSEYFKVTEHSSKDNTVTLKGSVMRKNTNNDGGIEYEYGKQDSELTFDANHAEITYREEGKSDTTKIKFSEYLSKHGDNIKDKIFKVKIEDGVVKSLEESDYTANK